MGRDAATTRPDNEALISNSTLQASFNIINHFQCEHAFDLINIFSKSVSIVHAILILEWIKYRLQCVEYHKIDSRTLSIDFKYKYSPFSSFALEAPRGQKSITWWRDKYANSKFEFHLVQKPNQIQHRALRSHFHWHPDGHVDVAMVPPICHPGIIYNWIIHFINQKKIFIRFFVGMR